MNKQTLIEGIKAYARREDLAPSTVGFKIFGDGTRFSRMTTGGGITDKSFEKGRVWLEKRGINFDDLEDKLEVE